VGTGLLSVKKMSEKFCKRGKVMSRSGSGLTSTYNHFLFAPICEEANGMQLSVLSALARMDVAWGEAPRLAAMPKASADNVLVSTLDRVFGKKIIATPLVRLLPQPGEGVTMAPLQDCKSWRTTDLLVGVAGLCVSDISSIAAPSGNDDGRGWFYV
jgi:hypothetical protein